MKDTRLLSQEHSLSDVLQDFENRKKKLLDEPQIFGIQYNKKSGEKYRSVRDGVKYIDAGQNELYLHTCPET